MAVLKMTREEYQQKYGVQAPAPVAPKQGIGSQISEAFKSGIQKSKEGYQQGQQATPSLKGAGNMLEGTGKLLAGGVEALSAPLAPITKPIGEVINNPSPKSIIGKLNENKKYQKFANSKAGQATSRAVENVANFNTITGGVAGFMAPAKVSTSLKGKPSITPKTSFSPTVAGITREVLPTADRVVNSQVSKALDLTPGDIKNISMSTGNEVGRFMADNNLIGANKDLTISNVDNFYKTNYDAVRAEIGNVKKLYNSQDVPRYKEALTEIQKNISETPGLQESIGEVDALLKKKNPTLNDVQRVKELMDEHFSLYKVTGDVKESVAKRGLSNIRKELKDFIENEVKDNTGTDIKPLNNNVATARSISDAVEVRSTRGLTRSNLRIGDLGVFGIGMGMGGPLVGAGLLVGKKIIESPTFRLKFSKWLDGKTDSAKLQIQKDLEAGKIPQGVTIRQSSKPSATETRSQNSQNLANSMNSKSPKNLSINQSNKSVKSTAPTSNTSNRIMNDIVPKKKGLVQRAVDKYKSIPNKQGGFLSVPNPFSKGKLSESSLNKIPTKIRGEVKSAYDRLNNIKNKKLDLNTEEDIDTFLRRVESGVANTKRFRGWQNSSRCYNTSIFKA